CVRYSGTTAYYFDYW
nr:immunoglobulin heavy chain junction region [Macaca mulatta]MOW81288.1 immunoglobulin heavy chain junction region [Macaca mulatta]MOW83222.1 immunoglobulin heavy chain junction region [Macaca mulatta]